ncbi:MAG: hypothetical protein HQK49_06950 [Oligoflexia bacterium]|nr:hypothetical protein [Oligoflexia bacterium]
MNTFFNSPQIDPFINECKKLAATIISRQLKTNFDITSNLEIDVCNKVLKNNMSFIMIVSTHGNLLFKVMYSKREIEDHLKQTMAANAEPSGFSVDDLMKEYCNLFAGSLKTQMELFFGDNLGLSFPIKLSGIDELYFPLNKLNTYYNLWQIGNNNFNIICAIELEVPKISTIENFNRLNFATDNINETKIELF